MQNESQKMQLSTLTPDCLLPLEGEENKWYSRFFKFAMAGSARSISTVYCDEYKQAPSSDVPKSWHEAAVKYSWKTRAEQYDQYLRDLERIASEQARLKIREKRRKLIEKGLEQIELLFEKMEEDEEGTLDLFRGAKLGEINQFIKVMLENARLEFGDDPMSLQKEKEAAKENTPSEGVVVKVVYDSEIGGL